MILGALLSSATTVLAQSTITIYSEDFETDDVGFATGNAQMTSTDVADPDAAGNQGRVRAGDVGGGNTRWGSMVGGNTPLPAATAPGTSKFTATMKIYFPSSTTMSGAGRVGFLIRWNGVNPGNSNTYYAWDELAADTWHTLTLNDFIPAVDSTGAAVTSVTPVISFDDRDNVAVAGVAAYVDDFTLEVEVSDDDPNFSHNATVSYGEIEQEDVATIKAIPITNSGSTETLTVTAIDFSATSSDLYSLPADLTLPLVIAPGEKFDLFVSFTPGEDVGIYNAKLNFTSNDPTTPMLETNLSATVAAPLDWPEFIINGDFETGDLTGWRDNDRFDTTTDQARSGTTSAVFNLPGGNQWNEARFEHAGDPTDSIPITPEMIGKEIAYSAWYYRPETGGMAANDTIRAIFRWNAINTNNTTFDITPVGNIATGAWHRVSGRGTIPELGGDGELTTGVTVLWSFEDVGSDAVGGELMYIDDISIKIDIPIVIELKVIEITHDAASDSVSFTYQATPGTTYAIDRATKLPTADEPDEWIELSDSEVADEMLESFTDNGAPSTGDTFFYRVRVAE